MALNLLANVLPGVGSFLATRAIKRTTRTELHHEGMYIVKYIHWNTDIKPTALRRYNIYNGGYIH